MKAQTLYEAYVTANQTNLDNMAVIIADMEEVYTHREFMTLIDNAAAGFSALGISDCSRVGVMLNNTIEEPVTLLALNKLGACAKFIDFTQGVANIRRVVEESSLDMLVIDEMILSMEPLFNPTKLPVVVATQKRVYRRGVYTSYNLLLKMGEGKWLEAAPYTEGKPTVIITSSGTTGEPKPIVHTDYSVNCAAQKMIHSKFLESKTDILMKVIPAHIGLGLITTLYSGLLNGNPLYFVSYVGPADTVDHMIYALRGFKDFCKRFGFPDETKLQIFAAPMCFRGILFSGAVQDLSFVSGMLAGGSKMTKEELGQMKVLLSQMGCTVPICNGYGQNELCGAVTLNDNDRNEDGSAGSPVYRTEVQVVDRVTLKPLKPNQVGKILERSDSEFLGYENMPVETEQAYVTLDDGSRWFDTNDLGYMSDTGFLYITGRTSRVAIRFDCKILLDEVEEKMRKIPFVKDCAVTVTDQNSVDEHLTAFIVLSDTYQGDARPEVILQTLMESGYLSDREYPNAVVCLNEIPYRSNGKVDYQTLEQMAQEVRP